MRCDMISTRTCREHLADSEREELPDAVRARVARVRDADGEPRDARVRAVGRLYDRRLPDTERPVAPESEPLGVGPNQTRRHRCAAFALPFLLQVRAPSAYCCCTSTRTVECLQNIVEITRINFKQYVDVHL